MLAPMGLVPIIQRGDDVRAPGVDSRFRSGIYQRRSAALHRLGRKLQVGRRNGNGLCQIQMIRAGGIFTSRLFIFNRAHRFSFLFCSSASPKSYKEHFGFRLLKVARAYRLREGATPWRAGRPPYTKCSEANPLSSGSLRLCGISTLRLHQAGLDEAFFGLGA